MASMNIGMLTRDAIQTSELNGFRNDQTSTSNLMGMAMVQYSLIRGIEKSTASNLLLVGAKVPKIEVVYTGRVSTWM